MSCPNCKLFYAKCKAGCCGPVPIPREVFSKNFYLIQRPIKETINSGTDILPITEELLCPFLSSDFKCMIYEDRPNVCKKFGDESHIHMTCAFQTKDGKERTKKDTDKIMKQQNEKAIKTFGQ